MLKEHSYTGGSMCGPSGGVATLRDRRRSPAWLAPESPTRKEYADSVRAHGPPISQDNRQAPAGEPAGQAERQTGHARDHGHAEPLDRATSDPPADNGTTAGQAAEPRSRTEYAAAVRGTVTHYHAEFKGQPIDLYTDGARWAPGDRARGENVVGEKPDRSPGDLRGFPPTGEQLLDMDSDKLSRADRFRRKAYENADDLSDGLKDSASTVHDILDHPQPTYASSKLADAPHITATAPPGIDAGNAVVGAMALAVVAAEGIRWIHGRFSPEAKDHAHASDG
jgi:hypothetical protein